MQIVPQVLRRLDGEWVATADVDEGVDVLWRVEAPDGVTTVRRAASDDVDRWVALYGDATAHDTDVPGMLVSLLVPLAEVGCPVLTASTLAADVVLVPSGRLDEAIAALTGAGHTVR